MRSISFLFLFFLLLSTSFAHTIGFNIQKEVNGDYRQSFIVSFKPAHNPTIYLNTSCVFVSPRSDFTRPNHEYFLATIGGEFSLFSAKLRLDTGLQNWWAGNSQGISPCIEWSNSANLFWDF